jgi:hypothetical protein
MPIDNRTERFTFRATKGEARLIVRLAAKRKLKVAEYLRERAVAE